MGVAEDVFTAQRASGVGGAGWQSKSQKDQVAVERREI
jgi:hypothetical protein